jgi:hypothetical protein
MIGSSHTSNAAVEASIRAHYYQPTHSWVGRPPVVPAATYALVPPLTYPTHQHPDRGMHLQGHDVVLNMTDFAIVGGALLYVAGCAAVRLTLHATERAHTLFRL